MIDDEAIISINQSIYIYIYAASSGVTLNLALAGGGGQRLLVLAAELGGRWSSECHELMRLLLNHRARRTAPAVRAAARSGWQRRWWGLLGVALQQAVAATALGVSWAYPRLPTGDAGPPLPDLLDLAAAAGPSRLPWR